MNRIFYLPLFFLLPVFTRVNAQTDSVFWFAPPDIYADAINNQYFDRPIRLYITAYAQPATVTISQPAAGGMPAQTVNVAANGTQMVDLSAWLNVIETQPPNTVLNYGLKIMSTAPVTVYYQVVSQNGNSPEAFVLKGRNALGTNFWVPSQNLIGNSSGRPGAFFSFDIVAAQNNTMVTITPSNPIVGHAAGTPFTITLNEGQTWSGTATSQLAAQRPGGTRVISDKPVAITIKDDNVDGRPSYYGARADLIGDQIVPVELLGTEYIAINGGGLPTPGDQLFILATENGTAISENGTPVTVINAGQIHRLPLAADAYIQTSRPSYVLQLTGLGDFGMAMLPSLCSGSSSVSYVRLYQDLAVTLVVHNGGQGNFLINGISGIITASLFTAVPGTGGQWYGAKVTLPAGQYPIGSVITISNTSSLFVLGALDANALAIAAGGSNFGYFSNFRSINPNAWLNTAGVLCSGSAIALMADSIPGGIYTWTGPNGFNSSQQNPVRPGATTADSGRYIVSVNANGCHASDTIVVPVFAVPVVDLGPDTSICGDSVLLQSSYMYSGAGYAWSTGALSPSIHTNQPGAYWLEVTKNGCSNRDTVNVILNPELVVNLGNDTALCDADIPLVLNSSQPSGTQYLWSTGIRSPQLEVYRSGTYWLYVNRNGCQGSDTIQVRIVQTPVISIGGDTTICETRPLRIGMAIPGAAYAWNTGVTTPYTEASVTGDYILSVDLQGCVVRDTVHITAMPDPVIDLGPDDDICPEQTIVLDATYAGNNRYEWNTGDTSAAISVSSGGDYWVEVTSEYTCTGKDSIKLFHHPKPTVLLAPDTIVCEENPLMLVAFELNADSVIWSEGSVGNTLAITHGGQYIATGINKCGTGSDTILVKQIFCDIWVPNAFTPNGDGINDVYKVLGNVSRLEGFRLSLYNRWGEMMFHTLDKYQGWDGKYKGAEGILGTYVYILEYNMDGRPYQQKGNFHLLR